MKLIGLNVEKLYGIINYDVKFNSDVTFIFGTNGCGKTTVLNITEAIITGQLFKLFNYRFKKIELSYAKSTNLNEIQTITIESNKQKLDVNFNGKPYSISANVDYSERGLRISKNIRNVSNYYFSHYSFLQKIREIFNYVYLPLNRSYIPYDESDELFHPSFHNRLMIEEDLYVLDDTRDGAMLKIESLIYQRHSRANADINRISNSFRDSILKSQIEITDGYNIDDFIEGIINNSIPNLKKTQNAYIKILKELNLIDKLEEDNYNKFFTEVIKDYSRFLNTKGEMMPTPINLYLKFQEISKIQKTIDIAEKMEQRKAEVTRPLETFLNTMNSFIKSNEEGKEICINNDGQIYFKTNYSSKPISIQHLSSGEKQLITFFANLIFSVDPNSSGIFVVDEPELSLHLFWQKIFIDKVLEINPNIQLIFATHAPEIIGKRRNKMYKLEKHFTKAEK